MANKFILKDLKNRPSIRQGSKSARSISQTLNDRRAKPVSLRPLPSKWEKPRNENEGDSSNA